MIYNRWRIGDDLYAYINIMFSFASLTFKRAHADLILDLVSLDLQSDLNFQIPGPACASHLPPKSPPPTESTSSYEFCVISCMHYTFLKWYTPESEFNFLLNKLGIRAGKLPKGYWM